MKTFLLVVVSFIIGLVVGGTVWLNAVLNYGFDAIVENAKNLNTQQLNALLTSQKDKLSQELEVQKEKIIENIEDSVKEKLKEQIDNLFK